MVYSSAGIDDYCRLCAVESQLLRIITGVIIYGAEGENLCLEKKIISCLRIEVFRKSCLSSADLVPFILGSQDSFARRDRRIELSFDNCVKLGSDEFAAHQSSVPSMDVEAKSCDFIIPKKDANIEIGGSLNVTVEKFLFKESCDEQFVRIENKGNRGNEEDKKLLKKWLKHWSIICNECDIVLNDNYQFKKHYWFFHNNKALYTCSFCKNVIKSYALFDLHTFEHINNDKFKCKFCNQKFFIKQLLQIHLSLIHGKLNMCMCDECGKSFTSKLRLEFHLKNHQKSKISVHPCTECGKILQTKKGLAAHKNVHRMGRHFMCHICGKTFTQKINMHKHVKHHKGERPHSCEICYKSFIEKSHLNRHKSFHSKDRPFRCSTCNKTYKTERCLKAHNKIHRDSRPHVCSCGKGFLSSTKLKQHYNCHMGERPFACKYCERAFTNYPNWLKHTRRRHKVDDKSGGVV